MTRAFDDAFCSAQNSINGPLFVHFGVGYERARDWRVRDRCFRENTLNACYPSAPLADDRVTAGFCPSFGLVYTRFRVVLRRANLVIILSLSRLLRACTLGLVSAISVYLSNKFRGWRRRCFWSKNGGTFYSSGSPSLECQWDRGIYDEIPSLTVCVSPRSLSMINLGTP